MITETCRKILRNCAAALPAKGVLLISESVLRRDLSASNLAGLKDLIMLVANEPDARERSEQEYRSLLDTTGFDMVDLIRLDAAGSPGGEEAVVNGFVRRLI